MRTRSYMIIVPKENLMSTLKMATLKMASLSRKLTVALLSLAGAGHYGRPTLHRG